MPHWCHFIQAFETAFLYYSRSVLFKCANNLGSVYPKPLGHKIYETKFLILVSFIPPSLPSPPIFFFCNHFNFLFDAQNLLLVNVAVISLSQSPVNCMSSKVERYLMHKVNYRYYCHILAWNLFSCLKELDGLLSQVQGDVRIFKIACFLENFIGTND